MLDNSKNIVINGGIFSVTNFGQQQNGRSGIELLKEGIAPGAFHNSSERYDPPKCHPHTRLAVLEAIMDWIQDGQKTSFLMWLYGPAGAGKSAIAQTIAEWCHRLGILAASFFWSRSAAGRNNEKHLIASLTYQLIIAIPQMRIHVETAIENDPILLSRSLEAQMESLVIEPLEKTFLGGQERTVDLEEPKLVILDGLDECGRPSVQGYILKVIFTALLRFPLRIHVLVASRPEQEIRDSFNAKPLLSITTRLSLDDNYLPNDDIGLFLIDSFTTLKESHVLRSLLPTTWPTTEDIDMLVQKSSGQFIYAATVVKFVKSPRRRPDEQLKIILGIGGTGKHTPFAELDALYLHIFSMVEDLPRVLEIMSCLYFLRSTIFDPDVDNIEKLLFYGRGDVHLILSDLHSVLDVPDITSDRPLHVFHASLEDFLTDPNRSGTFFLDESIARAQLAQCFMRHIRNFPTCGSETDEGRSDFDCLVANEFIPNCLKASPTRDLLRDFLGFHFKHWVSAIWCKISAPEQNPRSEPEEHKAWEKHEAWHEPLEVFEQVIMLSAWFREQEPIVKEHFGTEVNLYNHHSHERGIAINMLLEEALKGYFNPNGIRAKRAKAFQITAITHPLLISGENRWLLQNFICSRPRARITIRDYEPELRLFPVSMHRDGDIQTECIVEIQHFLCDPKRAGCCYVDNKMYAALSLWVAKVVFELVSNWQVPVAVKYSNNELQQLLPLAVDTLPFYLLNADYTSELADYLLGHTLSQGLLAKNYPNIQSLQDAIDLYLKRKPHVKKSRQQDEISISGLPRKRQRK